jgi:hypothetical protein
MKLNSSKSPRNLGFALVATLLLLILLSILAVGLLSLSSVALRSSFQGSAQAEARANARLALMIAIGELQKQMGPDQRVSASGAILGETSVNHPHWTGVWDSWKAGQSVQPAGNDEPSEHSTIENPTAGIRPSYEVNRRDHFRSWLVSLDSEDAAIVDAARSMTLDGSYMPTNTQDAVILVGKGSLGSAPDPKALIQAPLVPIKPDSGATEPSGRYAWWVGDESQKANIMDDSYQAEKAPSMAERLVRQRAPASFGISDIAGLENIVDESQLSFLPSRNSLVLVGGVTARATEHFHDITTTSLGVLADVREGGLKRDLSTILERAINPEEVYNLTNVEDFKRASSLKPDGKDFLLYRFDSMIKNAKTSTVGEAVVPIQDLAAYYQLYDGFGSGREGGIQFSSRDSSPSNNNLANGIMVSNPDYGVTGTDLDKYLRQYTSLYRNPVLAKIEIILSYISEPRPPAEIQAEINAAAAETPPRTLTAADIDPYRLKIGISPAMTFWNPNNVSLVMNIGDPNLYSYRIRETPIPLKFKFKKSNGPSGPSTEEATVDFNRVTNTNQGELYTLFVSGNYPAVFQPGESKVFALRFASNTNSNSATNSVDFLNRGSGIAENFNPDCELAPGWNPEKFIRPIITGRSGGLTNGMFTFKESDYISATIEAGGYNTFSIDTTQQSRTKRSQAATKYHFRTSQITGRINADAAYKNGVVFQGFPLNGASAISNPAPRTIDISQRSGVTLKNAMRSPFNPRDDLPQAFFYYGIKAATETHESNNATGVDGSARRFPSRPFTHSTAMAPAFLDSIDPKSLYNYGWNWFFLPLDNLNDAPIEISGGNSGYYGGGYTAENGVTHVVQQQLPLTPPISIAALSHAHLGGFSLATEAVAEGYNGLTEKRPTDRFRRTTAAGWDGLAPHTLQAIGNSYAHPNIPPDKAVTIWQRHFQQNYTKVDEPFVDHSYLANKALWDEYFFSSISPRPSSSKAYSGGMTAQQVAQDFFFDGKPLPNPRIVAYDRGFDEDKLDELFASYDQFEDGFADKIAAHMMVDGPFNINSTSVAAWKALFSSLKGQDVSYLDAKSALVVGAKLDFGETDGVPVLGGPLPNGKAYQGSSSDPSDREQWTGFRELNETEIDELATAMVKQVKLRGPFLSLSDFINRRLEGSVSKKDLALRGALQAAIDDPDVSINEGFRDSRRKFSNRETSFVGAAFPEAMEGPVAYGSSAYVDQADILRGLPAQLTPRGDTFVIRAYGDSIDANGNIKARAWCEATLQRIPDYIDPVDEAYTKQSDLGSGANQGFGRKFDIIQFRWLNSSEI